MKQFIVTKKIAKHGKQAIIVIPKILESELRPNTIVKVTFDILKEAENEK
jgi:predicted membrane GTPase involved in stress response